MRQFTLGLCLLLLTTAVVAQTKKAVFIIIDGVPHDVIEKLSLPHFGAIASEGGFAKALVGGEKGGYSQTPTISAVGYNSVLTGTWANKHNVWDNNIAAPNYAYPTIFRLLKETEPQKKTAIFSSWLDNRTKLVGEGKPETGGHFFDYHLDSLEYDTLNFPHDKGAQYMHRIDQRVTEEAAKVIWEQAPDLTWVYLEFTDDMGHRYGDSPQYYEAVKAADEKLGRIWEAIQYRKKQFGEDWLLVATTDHGRDAATGKGHGGQSDRERSGWILTNAKGLNSRFRSGDAAIVDVMPTIARFMNIALPQSAAREVDGVPLTGRLSLSNPSLTIENNKAVVQWKALDKEGSVKLWLAGTNNFKTGGNDNYSLLKTVPLSTQKVVLPLSSLPTGFYKLVLEGPHNQVNIWMPEAKKTGP
jgi:hypothetical protein